ncbi:hypothetical protein B4081_4670 [Bacillus cereus]|nr:hypothetical protein B4081_4670 [Bacillus cereus]
MITLNRRFQRVECYICKIDLSGWVYKMKKGIPYLECLFYVFVAHEGG